MLQEVFLVLAAVYFLVMVTVALAASLTRYHSDQSSRPTVSIVIAARNEEQNIRKCLASVAQLTYPVQLLEVVVVDDRSNDQTQMIVRDFAEGHSHIKLVAAVQGTGHLRGKANAVTQGIEASKGDIILFTDADCIVPPGWVEETVRYYTDQRVGIVAGFTSLHTRGWFSSMQALDWFLLFTVAAGAVGLHFPVTAVGNNLSVRRKAYDKVGGYRTIPFSVTEDYALFHAVTTRTEYRACFPLNRAAVVQSKPCETWKELYRQKKRWFTGGRGFNFVHSFLFVLAYLLYLFIPLSVVFAGTGVFLLVLVLKAFADLCLTIPTAHAFRRWQLLRFFPIFEIYLTAYVIVMPLIVFFGNEVIWKERSFEERE